MVGIKNLFASLTTLFLVHDHSSVVHALSFAGDRQEQFEFRRQLVLGVKSIREVDTTDSAVSVNLNSTNIKKWGSLQNVFKKQSAIF